MDARSFSQQNNINWYPGHMTKAMREMEKSIKLVDLVIELLDARVPLASRNPDIDKLANGKYRMIILNKVDLADPAATSKWVEYFEGLGIKAVTLDSRKSGEAKKITNIVNEICKEKFERDKRKGLLQRPVKAMVAGIPNVGKSTFINSYAGKASAKTGNKPGVTKGLQWINLGKNINLIDTPGVLWPKFESHDTGMRLAIIGSINDNILSKYDLAEYLINYLINNYCGIISKRYNIEETDVSKVLLGIADSRKCLMKGGEPDTEKAAAILIDDMRSGSLGRISLERLQEKEA
ncbi:MAG TPA: ribosome biogenesis GTPase YlqF [Lachnospiraceae bacterium]|nr:ribosome biogenesis GTPase YlqF [Lachnospiraceae bacterium]